MKWYWLFQSWLSLHDLEDLSNEGLMRGIGMTKKDNRNIGLPNAEYLTVAELADHVGVSHMTIYRLIQNGDVNAIRIGRSFRVSREVWDQYLENAKDSK